MGPTKVKGKEEPVRAYKVLSPKEEPSKIHRLQGLRADLIGRKNEMAQLEEAVEKLQKGKGTIFSISGDAGTGKSRLVEEFKASLDPKEIHWNEGYAYAYSQNIPYFPLIDFLNRLLQIEEGDPPEKVRERVELGIEDLVGKKKAIIPYVGSLYALSYPEVENVSPEFWKSKLLESIQTILAATAKRAPTIFCLEDLHWADPSFVELLRNALSEIQQPAIVLCVYRPEFSLFTSTQLTKIGKIYQEIRLRDLSPSDAQQMLESLLKTEIIPTDLSQLVQDKAVGNPFYLEELVNSLIESETLIRDNGNWKVARTIIKSDISSTIHGVISARLDRLKKESKRILQEASVIGRVFLYEILKRITEFKQEIDQYLRDLEHLDLIRTRAVQPDLEFVFKHALTQEVVYNGLLKRERKEIHEHIAQVIEQLFHGRLSEFYETLAFHFKQSQSLHKSIDYLMKSGEKSLKRYAVEESHQYYKEAFELLTDKPDKTKEEERLLIDLIIRWALVFYYRGDFRGWINLFMANEALAKSLDAKERLGMFDAMLGFAKLPAGDAKDSYKYLRDALKIGEEIGDQQVIGYACCWLSWTCGALGFFEEGIECGKRALSISKLFESDHYLYFKTLGGIGYISHYMGDKKRANEAGKALLEYGKRHSNIRSIVLGHNSIGLSELVSGDYPSAIECYKKAVQIAQDPFYREYSRVFLGLSYLLNEQFDEAEEALQKVLDFSQEWGFESSWGMISKACLGVVTVVKGELGSGLRAIQEGSTICKEIETLPYYAIFEHTLGKVYLQIVQGEGPKNLSFLVKNIGFLLKNVPFAGQKAEKHFLKAIEVAKEIGAKGILGQAYLDLGLLHKAKKRIDQANKCISEAAHIFEQCEAQVFLKQAKEALKSLGLI